MKPFNLEEAKQGKPICARDGRPARIVCFNQKSEFPLVALIDNGKNEVSCSFTEEGKWLASGTENDKDLFMVNEKHIGWANIYNLENSVPCLGCTICPTKEEAQRIAAPNVIATVKIEWED